MSTKPSIGYPDEPGFKVPGTSQEAAEAMKPSAATLRGQCLKVLQQIGEHTADGVAAFLGESVLSVRPRFSELLRLHEIIDTGRRRRNASGRNATVWAAAPAQSKET